jgi:parvulin-like peptidyl-prolyl isomerase
MLRSMRFLAGRRWGRASLVLGGAAALVVGVWFGRGMFIRHAAAQQAGPLAPFEAAPTSSGDYTSRVVAYIHTSQALTRQDLGEYLIHRYGAEKLPLLMNKRLIDEECQKHGVVVNAAEVDAALAEDIRGMSIDQDTFVKTVLARSKKNLYEWKEDILRPRLQMTRLVQDRLQVNPADIQKAFESVYGEKVECRIILWPQAKQEEALKAYGRIRNDEAAFAEAAKNQWKGDLAATGGKLKPIPRHAMDPELEKRAFELQPGQVSTLLNTPEGIVVLRCDKRIPPDASVSLESVKDNLVKEVRAAKVQSEMAALFQRLRHQASPNPLLKQIEKLPTTARPPSSQVVAWLYNNRPITREDLGEFLIARYGSEKVDFMVNRQIIDQECVARNVTVTEEDVDRAFQDDLKLMQCKTKKEFENGLLSKWGKTVYEWREDVIRPRLMLRRLCESRVTCTDEDVKKAHEAYHGDRLECRMIVWPPDQADFARTVYTKINNSEREFDLAAKSQPLATLANKEGKIDVFGRNSLGDENLEREAFKLQPGDTSALIQTPQGVVMIRCDKRIPPDTKATLEQTRAEHTKEIIEKKVQIEMQVVFQEIREKAKPQVILKWFGKPEDLVAESRKLMADIPNLSGK